MSLYVVGRLWEVVDATLQKPEFSDCSVYLTTDSPKVKADGERRYGERLVQTPGPITHSDRSSAADARTGFSKVILDNWLIGEAEVSSVLQFCAHSCMLVCVCVCVIACAPRVQCGTGLLVCSFFPVIGDFSSSSASECVHLCVHGYICVRMWGVHVCLRVYALVQFCVHCTLWIK